jgi:hypothetical protein
MFDYRRMPIFIGDQGTEKGIILGNLLIKIFDKLGIHCTNFGSVPQKFNSDLEFKSFVFVDEGMSDSVIYFSDIKKLLYDLLLFLNRLFWCSCSWGRKMR